MTHQNIVHKTLSQSLSLHCGHIWVIFLS